MGPAKRMLSGPSLEASAHRLTARTKFEFHHVRFPISGVRSNGGRHSAPPRSLCAVGVNCRTTRLARSLTLRYSDQEPTCLAPATPSLSR